MFKKKKLKWRLDSEVMIHHETYRHLFSYCSPTTGKYKKFIFLDTNHIKNILKKYKNDEVLNKKRLQMELIYRELTNTEKIKTIKTEENGEQKQ